MPDLSSKLRRLSRSAKSRETNIKTENAMAKPSGALVLSKNDPPLNNRQATYPTNETGAVLRGQPNPPNATPQMGPLSTLVRLCQLAWSHSKSINLCLLRN